MDRRTSSPQTTAQGDPRPHAGPDPRPRPPPPPQGGTALIAARAFLGTVQHFFPELPRWLDELPDRRDPDAWVYETRFMAWWGLWLYLGQLGSRRQLDFALDARGTHVLDNVNRLAGTDHDTRPVHDTLDYFVGQVAAVGFADLRTQMVRRLIRMKALDKARLLGYLVVLIDGTGLLCWSRRHCPYCLVRKHKKGTLYLHQVLEAKILGPAGVVASVGSEFIANDDLAAAQAAGKSDEEVKQDCELNALLRLAPRLKKDFPQAVFVLAGDSLLACGRTFQVAKDNGWHYVLTFKEGRMPAVWQEFQTLLPLCPRNRLERVTADGVRQVFRWVKDLEYQDSKGRRWRFTALECVETAADGTVAYFAWLTDLPVSVNTVVDIATKGGRYRWKIENEGFNRQKNSGLNLGHVYSINPEKAQAYYYLLQIAFLITQLLERGSLLRQLASAVGPEVGKVFGSLANISKRLLEGLRYCWWPQADFEPAGAGRWKIRLDSS